MPKLDKPGAAAPEGAEGPDRTSPADAGDGEGSSPAPGGGPSSPAASSSSSSAAASDEASFPADVQAGPAGFGDLARHFRRLRLIERVLGLALILFLFIYQNWFFALGALMGALLLDANLAVFQRVIDRAVPGRQDKPVWVTILKFYALFALTVVAAFLLVWLNVGEPLGFLGGILLLLPALLLTVLWSGVEFLASVRRVSGNA
jgi:hypothetical protein